jgi:glycosyltransferase involved in cell wall biosynthesis
MSATVSVIIPVRNSAAYLRDCLEHLNQGPIRPLECIVVDDGSSDDSAAVAREHGATTICSGRQGPAAARNLGAKAARGDILLFLDADVRVHGDSLRRVLGNFDSDPQLDAVIGSYDDSPGSRDFISLYKNLMHCFQHQQARPTACTFWSGCGAIRKDVFLAYSGFDQRYRRPAIEDIELGYRLARGNCKILLDKAVQVKHLKRWTFWNVIKTDIMYRGIPWTELILRDRFMPNDLNVRVSERVSVGLTFVLAGLAAAGTIRYGGYFLIPFIGILLSLLATCWIEAASQRQSRDAILLMAAFAGGFLWLAHQHQMMMITPPVVLAYALLFLRSRYGYASKRRRRVTGLAYALYLASAVLFMLTYLPNSPLVYGIIAILLLLVIIHRKFYVFFGSKLDRLSALAVIPLHMLYHFYNGVSFVVGLTRHTVKTLSIGRA